MAEQMVQIRSVKEFFRDFIAKPAQDNGEDWLRRNLGMLKAQMLDAFRKEIFGQIVFKLGEETNQMSLDEVAELPGVQNILEQAFRKWRRLCILSAEYGLGGYFQLEDLRAALEIDARQVADLPVDEGVDVTDQIQNGELRVEGEEPVTLDQLKTEEPSPCLAEDGGC